ncbi:hypothetical protein CEE36_01180 [candidate division TA06 bacterium B3_TA06]|uniref:Uncharacterized protein n=1 Tax=candidate division TA06 bacterium B3_TA06 TaxID=2012487 RepID=A0A532VB12_UNCT6|nr:MAG: hypothetical protein CEE36_01180 [candidate division TA06 bacterium B3_TA06]
MTTSISEKTIEDILTADKTILAEILSVNFSDLSLVARQKTLESGNLDLLYLHKNELLLIELKVVDFYKEIINQINGYYEDLIELQSYNRLIKAPIKKTVMVTGAKPSDLKLCDRNGIELIVYKPEDVLSKFFDNFREMAYFLKIESADSGVVRLGLLKPTLLLLVKGGSLDQISANLKKSKKTIGNRLTVASRLNLVTKFQKQYFLTDFGSTFLAEGDSTINDRFSQEQLDLLAKFIMENPFFSSVTFTIFSMVESVFVLSKSNYPVPFHKLRDYFIESIGKSSTWKRERAKDTATYIFSNYACELQLLSKVSNHFYLTPLGIHAVLLLQLNRSIKLIESQK